MKKIITQVYSIMYQSEEGTSFSEKIFMTVITICVLVIVMLFPLIKTV